MARWSDLMKLSAYESHRQFLEGFAGCYEIGYAKGGYFSPKYVGRGANIWKRIETYMDPNKCHNDYILEKLSSERHNLWFRVLRTERYHGLEARMQDRHGIGETGLYTWNKRVERSFLGE
jgi:hypothetical protein